jgi:hypothetical protein
LQINEATFPQTIAYTVDFVGFPGFPWARQPVARAQRRSTNGCETRAHGTELISSISSTGLLLGNREWRKRVNVTDAE